MTDDSHKGTGPGELGARLTKEAAGDIRIVAKGGAVQVFGQVSQRSM